MRISHGIMGRRCWVSSRNDYENVATSLLDRSEVASVLSSSLCSASPAPQPPPPTERTPKPAHYKVICISLYNDDLQRLDAMVDSLKARGMTKANRSALIRYALNQVDLDSVPRGL